MMTNKTENFPSLKSKFNALVARDAEVDKGYNDILHTCLNAVILEMKNTDKTFRDLYQEIHFSGSFYDNLAVGNTRQEFDLNVIYKVPEDELQLQNPHPTQEMFMDLSMKHKNASLEAIVDGGKICAEKMKSVMKTAADRALTRMENKVTLSNGVRVKVTRTETLPYTLVLKATSGRFLNQVEVDLVPALKVSTSKLPPELFQRVKSIQRKVGSSSDKFMAIAIPTVHKDKLEVDFPQISREILEGKQSAKMAIRLLKQERNEKGGPMLKIWSHAIKTAALHEVLKNPDVEHWHEEKLAFRLVDIRNAMQRYLSSGKMTDLFFPTVNMMDRIKSASVKQDVAKYLERTSASSVR